MPHDRTFQRRTCLTLQVIKIIAGQMDWANATVVYLLACAGLRIGEALVLRYGDVDLIRNRLNVLRAHPVAANLHLVETLPKGNRTRFVPVPSQLLPMIKTLNEWSFGLRHTYASPAMTRPARDMKTLQAVLGHASATETLDTYADQWPKLTARISEFDN